MFNKRVWLIVLVFLVSGCSGKGVGKLVVDNADPIEDVSVVMWMSDISKFPMAKSPKIEFSQDVEFYRVVLRNAIKKRLPAIFEVNDVSLKDFTLSENYVSKKHIDYLLDNVSSSHLLVLNVSGVSYKTINGDRSSYFFVHFHASLFDVERKLRVWVGGPIVLSTYIKQPLLRSQLFTGDLIRGLSDDGLIKLKSGNVVDLEGKSIGVYFIWEDDR